MMIVRIRTYISIINMKNNTTRFIFVFALLFILKISIVAATDDDDDDHVVELIEDIIAGIIGAILGACFESQQCSAVMFPTFLIFILICAVCSCICPNDDYDDSHKRRFRYRTAGAGLAGYTAGKMIARNW